MAKTDNITIVGAGFGGVKAALELAKKRDRQVTLISDKDYFQYYPALFSTATGHDSRESFVPLKDIFSNVPNVKLVRDTITKIDPSASLIRGSKSYHYETLILALGSVTTYFGIEGLDTFSYGIKTQAEIKSLQAHLWQEMSDGSDDEKHYVVIGGGPTGVELAGALGQYIRELHKEFGITKKRLSINLIEAAPRILPRSHISTSRHAHARLRKLGVHVEVNKKVEKQTADSLIVNGKPLPTQTVIWTSGVASPQFYADNKEHFTFNDRGKIVVDAGMQTHGNVFVIGDNAATKYSGLAQTALHDALFVAGRINGKTDSYKEKLPPCVIPVGNNWATFEWGWLRFHGRPAAFMRSLADMIGYHDVLPIGWTITAWRAQRTKQLRMPLSNDES